MSVATLPLRCELTSGKTDGFILDSTHRCDRCGAQAYVKATLREPKNPGEKAELFWCRHHGNKYQAAMTPICQQWHDETEKLEENRKQGSEN